MSVGPIFYQSTYHLLKAAHQREKHPLMRPLLAQVLATTLTSPTEETAQRTVQRLLTEVVDGCCTLSEHLRQRHPCVPADPQEQERFWQEARAELVQCWGYADVTEQVRQIYERHPRAADQPFVFDYRFVFQSPKSVYYISTLAQLLLVLDDARQAEVEQQQEPQREADPQEEDKDAPRL